MQYLKKEADHRDRVKYIQKRSKHTRYARMAEDVGILMYMRRVGLEKKENENKPHETVNDFRILTSNHPVKGEKHRDYLEKKDQEDDEASVVESERPSRSTVMAQEAVPAKAKQEGSVEGSDSMATAEDVVDEEASKEETQDVKDPKEEPILEEAAHGAEDEQAD